jgi:CubicO group peptidase (beta-lactamase class C family)
MLAQFLRLALAAATVAAAAAAQAETAGGPRFRADGPDAAAYGFKENYPACTGLTYIRETRCRVGAFSDFGRLFPSRLVRAAENASPLRRAEKEPETGYVFEGRSRTLDDYLDTYPITGLLIAKGDRILVERYQYARTDRHLMSSFSMAKSVLGLMIGIAVEEGAIRSIDDRAEAYVPELRGTEFGRTPIKALLQMASGIAFNEDYSDPGSDIYALARLTLEQAPAGSLGALRRFDTRRAAPGARFNYSSADSVALGLVLARATGRTISDYASEKLWRPLGAEADANWNIDATGHEIAYAYFNAVLRDWARLGLMLAHGGTWSGRTVVPAKWVAASTSAGRDSPSPTYGFHIWISPFGRDRFLFSGLRGQYVLVDPGNKLVLVQTALANSDVALSELTALWMAARARLR